VDKEPNLTAALLQELKTLNKTLNRLAEAVDPVPDPSILDDFIAFRTNRKKGSLTVRGIRKFDPVRLQELRGLDDIIAGLMRNTLQFLRGVPCNNVLLYGPRGTGKSSLIKALLNAYAGEGLRLVEMQRDTLFYIFEVAEMIKERPERFILFCDDLSFDANDEQSYRQLKSVLEGGLERRPDNMLIYATSNRRHLMPERPEDNFPVYSEGELHPSETLEEKISLSDRFGLRFGLPQFDMETYLEIVYSYTALRSIKIPQRSLKERAMQWSLSHGSYSGRTARQFIDDLEGFLQTGKK
jgi:uncharacterized protein